MNQDQVQITISKEQLQSWHPFFALPCYDMAITEPFFMSIIQTTVAFKDLGMNFSMSTMADSLISRARNQLAAKFLANPEYTHLLFIDSDIGFKYEDILKMLWHDKGVMTGAYPIKEINWHQVKENVESGVAPEHLLENSIRFVVNAVANGENLIQVENGAMKIYDAGTGFMLIKREVFLELIEAYPELKYNDDTGVLNEEERNWSYAFFNSYVDEDTGRFLSEDYGFCRYLQKIGGEIWVDPTIELSHLGRMKYSGKMIDFISKVATFTPNEKKAKPAKKAQAKKATTAKSKPTPKKKVKSAN